MWGVFDRYVARNVLAAMLITELVVVVLNFGIVFINKLGGMSGDYGVIESFIYQCLRLPWRIYQFAPLAVLLGGLLGLGNMAASNEITAMRAAGVSTMRLTLSAIMPMLMVSFLTVAMGQWLVPPAEQLAQTYKVEKKKHNDIANVARGVWEIDGNTIYRFGALRLDNSLVGILRFDFDGLQLTSVSYADSGVWDPKTRRWHMNNTRSTTFSTDNTLAQNQQTSDWHMPYTPELLSQLILDTDTLSITGLWHQAHYQDAQGISSNSSWINFWQKVLQPISFISLMMVAASFVFGPLRSKNAGARIFTGIVIAVCVKYLQDLLAPASLVFGIPPFWAVMVPIGLCFLLGIYLFMRKR